MLIKSFGCSLIFGTDLPDCTDGYTPSRLTWPARIAQALDLPYRCFARPGIGNLAIADSVLQQITDPTPSLYVIAWTWIDRFDYTVDDGHWNTARPGEDKSLDQYYFRNLHSQYRDKLQSLIYIQTCIQALQQADQRFLMTYNDELLFETDWHVSPAISMLQQEIRPHMHLFEGKTFMDFARDQGFDISAGNHPDAQAHEAASEIMLSAVKQQ